MNVTPEQFEALMRYIRADSFYMIALYAIPSELVRAGEMQTRYAKELAEAFGFAETEVEWSLSDV